MQCRHSGLALAGWELWESAFITLRALYQAWLEGCGFHTGLSDVGREIQHAKQQNETVLFINGRRKRDSFVVNLTTPKAVSTMQLY